MELADFQKMEQVRGRVDSLVEDPTTAEAFCVGACSVKTPALFAAHAMRRTESPVTV